MMKRGFFYIEILMGLTIFGLVCITSLPLLNTSMKNFVRIKDNSEMYHIGEMVMEKLKTSNPDILDILTQLEVSDKVDYIDDDFDNKKYSCQLIRIENGRKLLEFKVIVSKVNQEKTYVEYRASIPKN